MQRNYPRMFTLADGQGKDGFKLENVGLKIGCTIMILVQPFVLESLLIFL